MRYAKFASEVKVINHIGLSIAKNKYFHNFFVTTFLFNLLSVFFVIILFIFSITNLKYNSFFQAIIIRFKVDFVLHPENNGKILI